MPGPLNDLFVLDLTREIAGPYATKLLADYGADVVKVEPLEGDPSRHYPPFKDGVEHPERSGTFFYFNTNKRSLALDLGHDEARDVLARLIDRADIVVESLRPGELDALGAGWPWLHARRPDLPLVSITEFGQSGPYRDYRGSELVLYGYAGELYTMGIAEREPVKMYGTAALVESGAAASTAILAAAFACRQQGIGQHVDFAVVDSQTGGVDRRPAILIAYEFSGRKSVRPASGAAAIATGVYPCADGYVEFTGAAGRLDRLAAMLGNPEWFSGPRWEQPGAIMDPALVEEFNTHFYPWLMERPKRQVWDEARRAKVLCGALFTVQELHEDAHFRGRGFWATATHAELDCVELPGRPFIMSDSPWELRRPAPLLGEHSAEVLAESGYTQEQIAALAVRGVIRC